MKTVSFDVWSTLLNIEEFYRKIAAALSEISAQRREEIFTNIKNAYVAVKNARRKGLIQEEDVIASSTKIFLEAIGGFSRYELYWSVARAVNLVEPEKLLLPGAMEVLETLHAQGYMLAVTSNVIFWPGYVTRVLLDKAGLGKYFKVQVYADEVKSLKPNAKPFQEMLKAVGSEPRECAHVGDSPQEDLAGALNAGLAAVLVDWGRQKLTIDDRLRIAVVGSLKEVPQVIEQLLKF